MHSILVVEDNVDMAYGLRNNLEQEGYAVHVVHFAAGAIEHTSTNPVSLVLLDLMLPDLPGLKVLEHMRAERHSAPVIVLSAIADESVRVAAFRTGADDYVIKPFSILELLERVALRLRTAALNSDFALPVSAAHPKTTLRVNVARREVCAAGKQVHLTPREFDVLCALIRADGAVVSYDELIRIVWKLPAEWSTQTAVTHVGTLRRKLATAGFPDAILTVPKHGVRWMLGSCIA